MICKTCPLPYILIGEVTFYGIQIRLRNPAGEVVTIVNLDEFCANYPTKLTSHCLSKLYRGKLDKYKGWTRVE